MAIILRGDKGVALTVSELDGNFTHLEDADAALSTSIGNKIDTSNGTATGTLSAEIISASDDITTSADLQGANLVDTIIRGKVQNLGDVSGSVSVNLSAGDTITCKITGNTTISITGLISGSVNTAYFVIENPGAGTITWPAATTFNRGAAPLMSATGKTLIILDTVDNGSTYMGVQSWRSYV
jgi:hypothetical protein